jgi:hypothetical protein
MTDVTPSPMLDGSDIAARLQALAGRLSAEAGREMPTGLTEPDEGGNERWEAAQVWAHIAEFVTYWHEQLEAVIAGFDGDPVPFGRTKTDPGRIAAIEVGRHEPIGELAARAQEALGALERRVTGFGAAEWNAVGQHEPRGEMDSEAIVERFVISHLEEHLDQLEGLRAGTVAG